MRMEIGLMKIRETLKVWSLCQNDLYSPSFFLIETHSIEKISKYSNVNWLRCLSIRSHALKMIKYRWRISLIKEEWRKIPFVFFSSFILIVFSFVLFDSLRKTNGTKNISWRSPSVSDLFFILILRVRKAKDRDEHVKPVMQWRTSLLCDHSISWIDATTCLSIQNDLCWHRRKQEMLGQCIPLIIESYSSVHVSEIRFLPDHVEINLSRELDLTTFPFPFDWLL